MAVTVRNSLNSTPSHSHAPRSRALRVGMVAPASLPVPPLGYGGTERVVSVLVEGLVARSHDVTLFAAPGSATSAQLVTPLEMPLVPGSPTAVADEIFHATSAFLRAGEFDVVHDHTGMGPALGAMYSGHPPVLHTLHGPWTALSRRLFGLVDHRVGFVAISEAQRTANEDLRYAGMVHNGLDLEIHPFNPVKEDFLVFLGRINAEKRPELAIEVARRAELPLVMMVKRSEPAERIYWDEVVEPLLTENVQVIDEPSHDVKMDLLGRARATLFPIDWPEPFGLVMTESLACGTPVIACPLGAAPEVVTHGTTGFLCSTLDEMVDAVAVAPQIRPEACRASSRA